MTRQCTYDGDRYRLATALLLWRAFHLAGGKGAEPDPDGECERLARECGVWDEVCELEERWAGKGKGVRK